MVGTKMDVISEELKSINQTLKDILGKMPESEHPFIKGMVVAGVAVGIFGILQAVDIILKWFGG